MIREDMREVCEKSFSGPYGILMVNCLLRKIIRPKCWGRLLPDLNTRLLQCHFANLSLGSNRAANASASGVPG